MSGLGVLGEARWEQSTKDQEEQGAVCVLGKLRHGAGAGTALVPCRVSPDTESCGPGCARRKVALVKRKQPQCGEQ